VIESWAVPLAALIVSLTALLYAVLSGRAKASADYVRVLEARVTHAEESLRECRAESAKLREENFDLMRRLMHVETITRAREG